MWPGENRDIRAGEHNAKQPVPASSRYYNWDAFFGKQFGIDFAAFGFDHNKACIYPSHFRYKHFKADRVSLGLTKHVLCSLSPGFKWGVG